MKRKDPVSLSVTQASSSSTTTASTGADISAKSSASAVSVEDFFNSIELPLSDPADPKDDPVVVKASEPVKPSSPEPMSVDEFIPGFGRNTSEHDQSWLSVNRTSTPLHSENKPLSRSASVFEPSSHVEREKELPTHKALRGPENVPTRPRSEGIPAPHLAKDDSRRSSSTPQPTTSIPRRGTKRPVAADFDSEPMPKVYTLSRTGSGAGFGNGAVYHPNPHVRRKMNGVAAGGFASLNSARRCVIDVSDSEDDMSEDETPSTAGAPRETLSSARDSALALELEIERMRKMIREREEMKLRKQVVGGNRFASWKASLMLRRWRQAGRRLFLGNRLRCPELRARWRDRGARVKTRSGDLRVGTRKEPKMVGTLFSRDWESGALLGSEAFVSRPALITCVCMPGSAGGREGVRKPLSIMIALRSAGRPRHIDHFASARHFPLARPLANLTLNRIGKQCWQVAASLTWMLTWM